MINLIISFYATVVIINATAGPVFACQFKPKFRFARHITSRHDLKCSTCRVHDNTTVCNA